MTTIYAIECGRTRSGVTIYYKFVQIVQDKPKLATPEIARLMHMPFEHGREALGLPHNLPLSVISERITARLNTPVSVTKMQG